MSVSRSCSRCGTTRREVQHESVEIKPGVFAHGALFCQRCYLETHPQEPVPELPPPPRRKAHRDPEWVRFRKRIIAALDPFHYVNENRVAARCPICEEPLGVRFKGQAPKADFVCHGGCDELDVVATLVGRAR